MGAGTGRLTKMLAPLVKSIRAYDLSAHMLEKARSNLEPLGLHNWTLEVGNNIDLPAATASADLSIAGWSFGHATVWNNQGWRSDVEIALREMKRVLKPGGTAVILETMGTGSEQPNPPTPTLADYYAYLENEHGFSYRWIRTDYQFGSLDEAVYLAGFFFGEDMAALVAENEWVILPECTGVWWLNV
jgi:ubiquinone/menaquinone biosynthesis C-methylase UbiE